TASGGTGGKHKDTDAAAAVSQVTSSRTLQTSEMENVEGSLSSSSSSYHHYHHYRYHHHHHRPTSSSSSCCLDAFYICWDSEPVERAVDVRREQALAKAYQEQEAMSQEKDRTVGTPKRMRQTPTRHFRHSCGAWRGHPNR